MADPTRTQAQDDRSWTITGAAPETRDKVKAAAAQAGMSIRAWVDRTLNAAADESLAGRSGRPRGNVAVVVAPKSLAEIESRLDEIAKRLPSAAADSAITDAAAKRLTAAVMRSLASGFDDMHKSARDAALVAEGKVPKRKKKKLAAKGKSNAGGSDA